MAFEGAQMVPVYDMNKSDNAGMMGGGAGWMWVIMLFFLLAWGGFGGGGFGGANGAVNTLTNEFLYTNLNNTLDRGFNQLANQNFGIQRDICQFPQPAYITCSPYTSVNGFGCGNGCGIV